jgi:hypothetical protein
MSEHWSSDDVRYGPRPVTLLMTDGDKALVRADGRRDLWVLRKHLHSTEQQAFVAIRRAIALHRWSALLRVQTRAAA